MRNTPSTPSWSPRDHSLLLSGCSCTKCRGIHSLLAMDSLKVQLHMCGQCLSYPSTHRLQADVHSKPTAALASLCCAVLLVPAPHRLSIEGHAGHLGVLLPDAQVLIL